MNPKRVYVKNDDGTETDITEGVQAMYDRLVGSLDWGSGFITLEDALPLADLAKACGFEQWEEAEKYVEFARKEAEEKKQREQRMAGNTE